jgi:hypothetical protein
MENLSLSIPIEPTKTTMSFLSKMRILSRDVSDWVSLSSIYVFFPILILGVLTSAISAYITGEIKNYVLMNAYIMMAGFYIIQRNRTLRRHGTILGKLQNKKKLFRIPNVIIYLFDAEFKTLRGQVQSDKNGRFTLFVPKGKYYLTFKADGYDSNNRPASGKKQAKGKFYDGGIIELKHPGYINSVVRMTKL